MPGPTSLRAPRFGGPPKPWRRRKGPGLRGEGLSRLRTDALNDDLFRRLSGAEVDAFAALALMVCTTDAEGWPHPAMLSYFEIAAVDRENLRLAVYKDSRTCANMRDRDKATLIIVDENLVCYLRGTVTQVTPAMGVAPFNAMMNLRVEHVKFDAAPADLEPDAFVTSGISYRPRTGAALAQARAVLGELQNRSDK